MNQPIATQPTSHKTRKRKPRAKNHDPERAWRRVLSLLGAGPMVRGDFTNKCSSYMDAASIQALVDDGKLLSFGRNPSYLCLPKHRALGEQMAPEPTPAANTNAIPLGGVQAIMADLHMHRDNARKAVERAQASAVRFGNAYDLRAAFARFDAGVV